MDDDQPDSPESNSEFLEFDNLAGQILTAGAALLKEYFGSRCPELEKDCEGCKRWKALDELTENPFAD